ncbi:asparagine synthase [Encephalitozoon intestinalis]|nr:asparagine synthase [Encephalitozoon intestinalis]UTX46340.1 asparagine synthase B [Encephalitozoon intestinalis]
MCGILAVISDSVLDRDTREDAYQRSRLQRHRGPDETGVEEFDNGIVVQERLALVGISTGKQPFVRESGLIMAANCEIYNWKEIEEQISIETGRAFSALSDAEVIIELYEHYGALCVERLQGMFAFILYDKRSGTFLAARDRLGIVPLYFGYDSSGHLWFASEMKCLVGVCNSIKIFPPGTYLHGSVKDAQQTEYYKPLWKSSIPQGSVDMQEFRRRLRDEVRRHLPDGNVAAVLSGGLDSSIIAGLAQEILRESGRLLSTYAIGISGSPGLRYAREVAEHIGSKHVEVVFTPSEGVYMLKEVIWHLETYDVATIRVGVPMYLLSRRIKKDGFRVILGGEGADEIFGGYLYFHQAPDGAQFHQETVRRVERISDTDGLRANKTALAWGVEARVPFLSSTFVDYVMSISPEIRMIPSTLDPSRGMCEKYMLRKAFSNGLLPSNVVWRMKEEFSTRIGYSWINELKCEASRRVSDKEFGRAPLVYSHNTPETKEGFYYRKLYEEMFGAGCVKTILKWIPKVDWGCEAEESERVQKEHMDRT